MAGALAGIVAATLCIGATSAYAKPTTSAEALEELTAQQESLDKASTRYFDALDDYNDAVRQRDEAGEKLSAIETELSAMQARLGTRARELYRTGTGSWIDILLGSTSFGEFAQNLDLIDKVNEKDVALAQEERELRAKSREQKAIMEKQVQRTSEAADKAYESYKEAEDLTKSMKATYERLDKEEQAYIAEQAALQAQQQEAAQQAQYQGDQAVTAAIQESGGTVNDDGSITDASGNTYNSPSEYSAATGNEIVDRAMAQLGADYVWGGVGGSSGGFDCSGFVSYALTGSNTRLGTTADFVNWNEVSDPQPGDVAVIHEANGSQHTGIYIGDGKMVHASDESTGVIVSDVQKGMKFVHQ